MDFNESGALTMTEFQVVVSGTLRYCRPSDACRLFLSFNQDPNAMVTWDELGILRHEWVNHVLHRRIRRLQCAAAKCGQEGGARKLGASPRQNKSQTGHLNR